MTYEIREVGTHRLLEKNVEGEEVVQALKDWRLLLEVHALPEGEGAIKVA